jgi:hypothetical protein
MRSVDQGIRTARDGLDLRDADGIDPAIHVDRGDEIREGVAAAGSVVTMHEQRDPRAVQLDEAREVEVARETLGTVRVDRSIDVLTRSGGDLHPLAVVHLSKLGQRALEHRPRRAGRGAERDRVSALSAARDADATLVGAALEVHAVAGSNSCTCARGGVREAPGRTLRARVRGEAGGRHIPVCAQLVGDLGG